MKKNLTLINGKFKDSISVFDRGLAYGDGFFETMQWIGKKNESLKGVEFWNRHFKRITKSAKILKINIPNKNIFADYKKKILTAAQKEGLYKGILKIIITRGVGGRGYSYESNMKPTIIFIVFPNAPSKIIESVNVKICKSTISNNPDISGLKHLNRLDSVNARSEWKNKKIFEGIFIDNKKNILEGTMTNIFFVKNKSLVTPSIISSGIKGIMREVVLVYGKKFFNEVIIREIRKHEIENFEEMFLTNSIIKVLPVKKFGKKKFSISNSTMELINFFQKIKNLEIA
ncbi:MAG: aminodeoxychorismate lyase [Rickettsiales bacterium]|nr:aminodeoxychorismate lyase [Rickettsiales bacterium]